MKRHIHIATTLVLLASFSAFADPATGWKQTGAGPYNYNDAANWVNGEINGIFGSDLTLTANQTITFAADTSLPDGLTFQYAGAYSITMTSDGSEARTLTLGGNLVFSPASNSDKAIVTIGSGTAASALDINLGGATRTVSAGANTKPALKILNTVSNGGLNLQNNYPLTLNSANTYADGTTLAGTGKVYVMPNAFGTGTVVFEQGAALDVSGNRTFTANNPLVFNGNWTFSGTSGNLNLGAGGITVSQPVTITGSKSTLTLGGSVVSGSLTDITKAGGGVLSTKDLLVLNGETSLCVSAGTWQFGGVISGTGTLVKTGSGLLELMASNTFSDMFVIREGAVRFWAKNTLAAGTRVLIEENGELRSNTGSECNYAYSVPQMLSSGIIDPSSSGTVAFASNESGNIDLTNYPYLKIGLAGNNFSYEGVITAAPGQPYRLGGGGKTLTIKGANALSGSHDVILAGSLSVSGVNDLDGTVYVPSGKTFTIGVAAAMPNATVVAEGGTVNFNRAGGDNTLLRNLVLNTSTLNLAGGSEGNVTHRISGTLTTDAKLSGGVSHVTNTVPTYNITLRVGAIDQGEAPAFLCFQPTVGATEFAAGGVNVVIDTPPAHEGGAGTDAAGVVPWLILTNGKPLRYDAAKGLHPLDPATEYAVFAADATNPPLSAYANLLVQGGTTVALTTGPSLGLIDVEAIGTADPTLNALDAPMTLRSGAIRISSSTAAKLNAAIDLGAKRGYVVGMVSSTKSAQGVLDSAISGTGGLSFTDCGRSYVDRDFRIHDSGNTYSGDTYIFGRVSAYGGTANFFPHGVDRPGDLYVYGKLFYKSINLQINGLYGNGIVDSNGGDTARLTVGCDGSDGNFEGTFVNSPSGANFGLIKEGAGWQRFGCNMGFKWAIEVNGGTLQLDGTVSLNRSDNVNVNTGGTLAGCGTIGGYNRVQVKSGGTLAPGSAEIPDQSMVITNSNRGISIPLQMDDGSALRFYVDKERASQVLVSGDVTGTTGEIPVTITGDPPPSGRWMLMEAASFTSENFNLVTDRGFLTVEHTASTSQLWYTTPAEATVILFK